MKLMATTVGNFYPRPPRGGRPTAAFISPKTPRYFYPRPPRGGRPELFIDNIFPAEISIHALREEGDRGTVAVPPACHVFLSTPSARRATGVLVDRVSCHNIFLSTPSARRATCMPIYWINTKGISIHALREEGD